MYQNCTIILTIYKGTSCRLITVLSIIGNKHGFLIKRKFKLSRLWCCSSSNICHIYQEKYGSWTSGYCLQFSSDHFVISQHLKTHVFLQIKGNLEIFSLFASFLAALFSSTEISETHWSKMDGVFVPILFIKLILVSWSFVCKFYSSFWELGTEKYPVDQIVHRLKSVD